MADTKISALTAAASFLDADELMVNEAGAEKKVSGTQLKTWLGDMLQNQGTASQTLAAAASTYLTNSNISIPAAGLRVGTVFYYSAAISKAGVGVNTRQFFWRLGTAGTTADAAILTFTSDTPNATADSGNVEIVVTVRGPLGASCIAQGYLKMEHDAAAAGFSTKVSNVAFVTSAGFTSSTANLIAGLSCTTGIAEAITLTQVTAEAVGL